MRQWRIGLDATTARAYEDGTLALDALELRILSGQFKSAWKDVAQADNAGEVYQRSTRLSSQVTTSHCESGYFGATSDLR
jgi:hypothetical protein